MESFHVLNVCEDSHTSCIYEFCFLSPHEQDYQKRDNEKCKYSSSNSAKYTGNMSMALVLPWSKDSDLWSLD